MGTLTKARLRAELKALVERFPGVRMLDLAVGAPTFEVTLEVDGDTRHVRLTLPPGYPSVPPEVRELDRPGGEVVIPATAEYRFADGAACLFPHGNDPQGWRLDRMAVEALERFKDLVRLEHESVTRPRREVYRDSWQMFVPPGIATAMMLPGGRGQLRVRGAKSGRGDWFIDWISTEGDPLVSFEQPLAPLWRQFLPREELIPWVNLELGGRPWIELFGDRACLDEVLRMSLPEAFYRRVAAEQTIVVVRAVGSSDRGFDAVHFRWPAHHLRILYMRDVERGEPQERLFHRVDGVMIQRARLREVRAVLVGLGSLGGAVAVALARAGVGRFVLIDPDVLSVDNMCRHVGMLDFVGELKVDAVQTMIQSVNPEAEVVTMAKHLAWDLPDFGAGRELEGLLSDPGQSVIVATCAVGTTERQLNVLAVERKVPVIFGAALGAAEHARVFRVIPGESACYECVLQAQARDPERFPQFVAEAGEDAREPYLQPDLPGLGIDVAQIAMLVARLTLQTIARVMRIELGLPDEVGHHLLWSNRGGWALCDRALQVAVCDVPRAADCPVCGESREGENEEDAQQALDELVAGLGRE